MVGRQLTLHGQAALCVSSVLCCLCRAGGGLLMGDACWVQVNPRVLCCLWIALLGAAQMPLLQPGRSPA